MFIQNCNLRKRLGMSRLMEVDGGAGGSGEGAGTSEGDQENGEGSEEGKSEEKTFSQEEVDNLIKDRLKREKKGQPTKEELKAFKEWQDSQKTESEKQSEALTNAEKAKLDAEERAILAETKVTCLTKGVNPKSIDDVVVLAKAKVTDDVTIDQAIDKVLEQYPHFKGDMQQEEQKQKGFRKLGGGAGNSKGSNEDALKAIFGIK
ncbi:hypothetical protein [Clostridium butyricum]